MVKKIIAICVGIIVVLIAIFVINKKNSNNSYKKFEKVMDEHFESSSNDSVNIEDEEDRLVLDSTNIIVKSERSTNTSSNRIINKIENGIPIMDATNIVGIPVNESFEY